MALMQTIWPKIRRFYAQLIGFWPSPLPSGKTEFDTFAKSILDLYKFPNDASYIHMIAMMIQHVPPDQCRVSKRYFYIRMRKAVANETAFYIMQDLKQKQKSKSEAEAKAPPQPIEGNCLHDTSVSVSPI